MLTEAIWKHFGLSRDPFNAEMNNPQKDVYALKGIAIAEIRIDRAVNAPGLAAVIGDVGTGKTTLIQRCIARWAKSKVHKVIQVHSLGRARLTTSQLADALLYDMTGQVLYASEEIKARAIKLAIDEAAKQTIRPILVVDEAHELPTKALKALKKIIEAQGKFNVNLAVILVGHPPLEHRLRDEVALREISERIDLIRLSGVSPEDGRRYLDFKLHKSGGAVEKLFSPEGLDLLLQHPSARYPLGLNNLVEAAMNVCLDNDERIIDEEVMTKAFHRMNSDGEAVAASKTPTTNVRRRDVA